MKTLETMKRSLLLAIIFTSFMAASGQIKTDSLGKLQDTGSIYIVKFIEGSSYYGKLLENRNDTLTLLTTDLGAIRIPYKKIKKVERVEYMDIRKGKYWFPQPLPGRYFFAPSAFSLKRGEGYYQNTMLGLNSVNVGITKWISLGGGIEFFSTIASITEGEFKPTYYITPKIGFEVVKNLRIGAGAIYMQIMVADLQLATVYGVVSYGNPDYNLTVGLGWGYSKFETDEWSSQKSPMITICGTARIARKIALVTENWLIPDAGNGDFKYYPLYSYGLRFFGETLSVDLAFINNSDIVEALFIGIPFVAFTVKF